MRIICGRYILIPSVPHLCKVRDPPSSYGGAAHMHPRCINFVVEQLSGNNDEISCTKRTLQIELLILGYQVIFLFSLYQENNSLYSYFSKCVDCGPLSYPRDSDTCMYPIVPMYSQTFIKRFQSDSAFL